ncbi:phage baseplate assembly protein V [Xylella fastidiosa]|uniref:phage baseplate assembly protein V n=1 Tax=Xylella fastidiosa TaxID=2371 RepID=UPI00041D6B68|nr:phage baseplate assembly protein V [Xylella fastidiosa]ALR05375.1 phage baseplate assembly protein V [Xylella fastidiosa]ALR05380.1 phage baseplate assembly protein V [Xylella fastidiosa]KXB19348.1 baseplate assembly protein [Xylella fastidiosa]OJZ71134.1 baseplate assembly protein [Xylella fastidiosa 6c]WGZ33608.1 phage baseplate assembly protein V [Xylella fastidiosa subsp. pauca]
MRQTLNEHTRQLAHLILQGTVAELDPATACVRIEAGELLTGWLPVMASRAGADRSWWLPHLGEQVIALCPNGDSALGIVLPGSLYQETFPAPSSTAHQPCLLFADGTRITYDRQAHTLTVDASAASGTVTLICATATLTASDRLTLDTPRLHLTGNLTVDGTIHAQGDITAADIGLQRHHHTAQGPNAPTTPAQG